MTTRKEEGAGLPLSAAAPGGNEFILAECATTRPKQKTSQKSERGKRRVVYEAKLKKKELGRKNSYFLKISDIIIFTHLLLLDVKMHFLNFSKL